LLVHRITGKPYSITTHAKDLFLNGALSSPHVQERVHAAAFVVANSHYTTAHIRRHVPEFERVHTIYNGIHLDRFAPRAEEPNSPLIVAVGRLVEKKGFDVLIEACHILPQRGIPFRCELIGTGRLSEQIKEQITAANLRHIVHLVGALSQEELRTHYDQALIC